LAKRLTLEGVGGVREGSVRLLGEIDAEGKTSDSAFGRPKKEGQR